MRKGAILTLILAIGLGGFSAYLAKDWIQKQTRPAVVQQQPAMPTTTVVVAKKALRFGDSLAPEFVEAIAWPAGTLPPNSFRDASEIFKDGKSRMVLKAIEAYEPILATKITGAGERATLSRLISEEMRAVTIRVNDVVGVAGFVLPGDRVDVLVTRRPEKEEPITDIVMQNIRVLGIDQDVSEDKNKPTVAKAVTVEVTPEQAQKLALAQQVGQLTLALRNEANVEAAKAGTVGVDDLSNGGSSSKARAPVVQAANTRSSPAPRQQPAVTVVRGLQATREEVVAEPPALLPDHATSEPMRLLPKLPETEVAPPPGVMKREPAPFERSVWAPTGSSPRNILAERPGMSMARQ